VRARNALGRHVAVTGFMGAGKSRFAAELAARLARPLVDLDAEIERSAGSSVEDLFAERGEAGFRALEEELACALLGRGEPAVIALGGGAVLSARTRAGLADLAFTLLLPVDPDVAWERVNGTGRPLAQDETGFRELHRERAQLYDAVADAVVTDADDACLAAAGVHVEPGALDRLAELVPGEGPVELVADTHVAGIHGVQAQLALGGRDIAFHEVAQGEAAKSPAQVERLWRALRIGRDGVLVALGGGATSDVVGFAAATWARGIEWVPVPTTLVGQVDAAIGGKTAVDLPGGKNLVGAFHWPARVIADPLLLDTLPDVELQNGLAEVVKTGLLAGGPFWELPRREQVRRCAAFKAGVCLADPRDWAARAQLNLGHTFAHALEAAAGFALPHGEAVALGLLAALRLSGNAADAGMVEEILRPRPVRVDRELAWAALARDKKAVAGAPRLVLLERAGEPRWGAELPEAEVRAALDSLIA
jgi:3-dehydroquinate synthetase/shikimate kinase